MSAGSGVHKGGQGTAAPLIAGKGTYSALFLGFLLFYKKGEILNCLKVPSKVLYKDQCGI